jgi:hypothetical protein
LTVTLYHNDGGGHFSDVTSSAGIPPYPFLAGAAAFVDVDHDGDLDLVLAGLADLAGSRSRAADRAPLRVGTLRGLQGGVLAFRAPRSPVGSPGAALHRLTEHLRWGISALDRFGRALIYIPTAA